MTARIRHWLILTSVSAVILATAGDLRAAPLLARVKTTRGNTWEGFLLKRDERGWVYLRPKDSPAEIGVDRKDIESVEFAFDVLEREIPKLIEDHDYRRLATTLGQMLDPTLSYLDLPTNAEPWVRVLVQALYASEQYQKLRDMSVFLESVPGERTKDEARLYRALARLGLGFPDDAEKQARDVGLLPPDDLLGGPYYYVLGAAQLARGDLLAAQESAAKIVAFQAKNLEWLPAGLYLSAQCYLAAGTTNVARQVLDEIRIVAPQTPWDTRAVALGRDLPPPAEAADDRADEADAPSTEPE